MALQSPNRKFNLDRICKKFSIESDFIKNTSINENSLKEIYDDFVTNENQLEKAKASVLDILNRNLGGMVHSIRARVKDPDHLIEKIIRNINGNPVKYGKISVDNYNKIITDLIGIRIIILNKYDWYDIHNSLLKIFQNIPERYAVRPTDIETNFDKYVVSDNPEEWRQESYHAERPVVYITSEDDRSIYIDENLQVDTAKKHYRSIHYIIRYGCYYLEIQVRTLFEEGWLEFDHRIKYPYDQNNPKKQEYIQILSSLAVAADRLISFYKEEDFKENKKRAKAPNTASSYIEAPSPRTLQDKINNKF